MPRTPIASNYTGGPDPDCRVVALVRLPLMGVWRVVETQPKTTPTFCSSWGLLVEAAAGCERPRRSAIEASLFVTTSVLLATLNRSRWKMPSLFWIRGVVRERVADIHVLAARKVADQQGSNVAPPRPQSGRPQLGAAKRVGSPRCERAVGTLAQYSDAPPPMTCASCAASVESSGRRRSSIRSASGRWPISTYVSPRYSMACGKLGRRRSASW